MNGLLKVAGRIGDKPIALVSLIIMSVAVAASLFLQHNTSSQQQEQNNAQSQQQTVSLIQSAVMHQINALNEEMASLVKLPSVVQALSSADSGQIEQQQSIIMHAFPHAQTACLLDVQIDTPNSSACLPISFATLSSLRKAKQEGSADMAILKLGQDDAHVLLAQRVTDSSEQVIGVLVVTLEPRVITDLLVKSYGQSGYIELLQGKAKTTKLVSQGNPQWKQQAASYTKVVPNSYWKLAYWPAQQQEQGLPIVSLAIALATVFIMWLLRELWKGLLIRHDAKMLRQQLADLKVSKLKPKYPLAYSAFQDVVDDVQTLGHELTAKPKKQAPTKANAAEVKVEEQTAGEIDVANIDKTTIDANIFKASDIRGIVGQSLNEDIMRQLGLAVGSEVIALGQRRIVVGRDGRRSSEALTKSFVEGVIATGCGVVDIGQVATPLVYFATEQLSTESGVMVTGSHNPAEHNGLKIVLAGKSLGGEELQKLYQRVLEKNFVSGTGSRNTANIVADYSQQVEKDIKLARPIKVVVDCGNGVAGLIAPQLLRSLGCEVTELYCDIDGTFSNHHPDPSRPENLADLIATVKQQGAELGLAFDGDGDRLGVVDGQGNIIWPDRLMIMFAQDVLSRQPGAVIIHDVKSSSLLADSIASAGGESLMTPSGHSQIKNKMQEMNAQLAGEMSGHIFFKERWNGFDDALYSACRLLELLTDDPLERTPTEVFAAIPNRENTPEILVEMAEGEAPEFIEQLATEAHFAGAQLTLIDGIRAEYPHGWGLVRASNTVSGLTLRFEADTAENLLDIQQQFKQQMLQVKPTLTLQF